MLSLRRFTFVVFIFIAPAFGTWATEKHFFQTNVEVRGGCRNLHVLRVPSFLEMQRLHRDDNLFGKPILQWSDDDIATAVRIYKDCRTTGSYINEGSIRTFESSLRKTIMDARSADNQRRRQQAARVEFEKAQSEIIMKQTEEDARLKQEQLHEQAQRDREAAEDARQLAEREERKIAEATRDAEEARRARQEAEQRLADIRSRIDAQAEARKEALAGAQAAEAARQRELERQSTSTEPSTATTRVQAIVMEDGPSQNGRRILIAFTDIRERQTTVDGRQVRLICSDDGIGEVVAEIDGQFYAAGGIAQPRINSGHFWIVINRTRETPVNADRSSEASWFRFNWDAIGKNVEGMCPAAWGPTTGSVDRAFQALKHAEETYRREAPRLGLELEPLSQSYDLPSRGSAAFEKEIIGPARSACETLGKIVKMDERRDFLASCFKERDG